MEVCVVRQQSILDNIQVHCGDKRTMNDEDGERPEPVQRKSLVKYEAIDYEAIANVTVENIADAVPITGEQLNNLIAEMSKVSDENEKVISILEKEKTPFLFCSKDLRALIELTESSKTKMAMIQIIATRLTDPLEAKEELNNIFKYAEDKEKVADAMRQRHRSLHNSQFTTSPTSRLSNRPMPRMSRGRGGRGARNDRSSRHNSMTSSGSVSQKESLAATNSDGSIPVMAKLQITPRQSQLEPPPSSSSSALSTDDNVPNIPKIEINPRKSQMDPPSPS